MSGRPTSDLAGTQIKDLRAVGAAMAAGWSAWCYLYK
jgi:hypothetical protein